MKKVLLAAALGGLGAAGLMAATPAQAACDTTTPPLTPQRVACVTNEQIGTFIETASPGYNADLLINGNPDSSSPTGRDGLGLKDQPATFVSSVGDFLNGPRSPE